jgi:Holliday junction resolvasome RuvABC endonuclease subunit
MKHPFVLGIHPSSRGFGWAIFEGPLVPFDWGTVSVTGAKNAKALARFEKLLDRYQPRVLALEDVEASDSQRSPRVRQLCRSLVSRAEARGVEVHLYTRSEISKTFAGANAKTRDEIAAAVAERIAVLQSRLPKPRKPWQGEHPNIALFAAAACALTYLMGGRS